MGVLMCLLVCAGFSAACSPYGTYDPGAPAQVLAAMRIGDCAHVPAFGDIPSETIPAPTPAPCDNSVNSNAVVTASSARRCGTDGEILWSGHCFALRWITGACYREVPGGWRRTGLCATGDRTVQQFRADGSLGVPGSGSNTYTVYTDWRAVGFDIWSTLVGLAILAAVFVVTRAVRFYRFVEGKPAPSRSCFGIALILFVPVLFTAWLLEWMLRSGASGHQLRQAQAFADDWSITIVDPTAMPGPHTRRMDPIVARTADGTPVTCTLSASTRHRKTGEWVFTAKLPRGEGSGWRRFELTCAGITPRTAG
ncbi:hypothetical protein ACFC06_12190 [Nocardia sp. NPDC056064]|uniref:hypothetical protein n=1 Tax=Nocardia sp. NPDC056064 TaxID=3345701 RepID=UPI0035DBE3CD